MDVETYVAGVRERVGHVGLPTEYEFLRAVLPGILARHRADLLAEVDQALTDHANHIAETNYVTAAWIDQTRDAIKQKFADNQ